MPNFRRSRVAGATYFFTVVTAERRRILCEENARTILRQCMVECRHRWPFQIDAIVLLPDHLHALWTLPIADGEYSRRWAWIKKEFTTRWLRAGGAESARTPGQIRDGRRGVLQAKFWEHTIRDTHDYERHADYIHYNPVHHGLCGRPVDWPYSSIHRWIQRGWYVPNWGTNERFVAPAKMEAGE